MQIFGRSFFFFFTVVKITKINGVGSGRVGSKWDDS